ncbi:MAG: GNAT superfamily N-acetyltransferase [Sulfitobacter sp.]
MKVICRALGRADYADARRLYEALSTGDSLPPDSAVGAAAFGDVIAHTGTTIFGAEQAGQVISMATLHILPNMTYQARPYALVENVATLPDHRGHGFGRQVMQALADHAWAAGVYKIMLLTGRANGAAGFYHRLGFDGDEKHAMILRRPDTG